jgi:hypothetical protein
MAFIGTPLDTRNTFQSLVGKRFNGDGSTTAFTLDVAPSSTLDLEVFVGNVRQDPNSAYTLSGTTLTFTGAPPSGTNNIYVVHQAKSVGTINAPDNSVDSAQLNTALLTGATDIGANIADADLFLVDDGAGGTLRKTAASRLKTYIGTSPITALNNATENELVTVGSTTTELDAEAKLISDGSGIIIRNAAVGTATSGKADMLVIEGNASGDTAGMSILTANDEFGVIHFGDGDDVDVGKIEYYHSSDYMRFYTGGSERLRIDPNLKYNKTDVAVGTAGFHIQQSGSDANGGAITAASTTPWQVNRLTNDGQLIALRQDSSEEGSISVSGSTVSYTTFCGAHWSRLTDNSKPTILRGTVIESVTTLCDWYQVEYTKVNIDGDGKESSWVQKESISLPDGKNVGDNHTITVDGVEYTGKIIKEDNEQLPKCKISDTEESKAVYGVFLSWDDADDGLDGDVNDMNVAGLGAFVVRIHKDETVAIGDYLQSKGDGTAKKQADDILRASTIAKVTSTEKTHTYSDGSYCVPCTLHCG